MKAIDGFSRCAVPDCQVLVNRGNHLCEKHRQRLRAHGDVNRVDKPIPNSVTDEKRAEIRALIHRFVSPIEVARRVGVSETTVRKVMKG